jgi:hypothetical protein
MAQKQTTKLNDSQRTVAEALIDTKNTGIAPSTWTGDGKFPTRTLQSLEKIGLAKSKEKKVDGTKKKEAFWFPTAKTSKVLDQQA